MASSSITLPTLSERRSIPAKRLVVCATSIPPQDARPFAPIVARKLLQRDFSELPAACVRPARWWWVVAETWLDRAS
jgi:hypothetical protein